ncbi:MAG TPA: hypothetical protein VF492_12080 [Verrucomicrobiae bacterium]
MNAGPAESQPLAGLPPAAGWGWRKIFLVILFAFAAHVAFVDLLGAKKTVPPRAVTNVPVFHLADNASEFVRLTDPTLFVLPHAEDYAPAAWSRTPAVESPSFSWTEAPSFLASDAGTLGTAFNTFMQTNRFVTVALHFKPEPQPVPLLPASELLLPQNSTWQLAGEIAQRPLLNTLTVPSPAVNDVIEPSRAQLLVDKNGEVVSTVLMDTSGDNPADQTALALARTLRFAPADRLMFGEIIFHWHTVPTNAP